MESLHPIEDWRQLWGFLGNRRRHDVPLRTRWAEIRVKCDGLALPKVTILIGGDYSFEIQLLWEIQPRIVVAMLERPSEKTGSPMGEDKVFSCADESVRLSKGCCPQGASLTTRAIQGRAEKTTCPIV